jgi:hypothetical protein
MAAEGTGLGLWLYGLIFIGLGAGVVCSVQQRRKNNKWRSSRAKSLQSPLSQALAHLVGTAGGIYLSLELLCTFLGLSHEEWHAITPLAINPLAAFSLIIAIVQPFMVRVWEFIGRRIRNANSSGTKLTGGRKAEFPADPKRKGWTKKRR